MQYSNIPEKISLNRKHSLNREPALMARPDYIIKAVWYQTLRGLNSVLYIPI